MNLEIVETKEDDTESTTFQGTRIVAIQDGEEETQMRIEYGFAPSYGRTRRCIKIRRPGESPIMTFLGGDRWGRTHKVFAKLRKPTGRGYIHDFRNIDPGFSEFETCRLRRFIEPRPGRRVEACWAVAAKEDDLATMISAAITYEKLTN